MLYLNTCLFFKTWPSCQAVLPLIVLEADELSCSYFALLPPPNWISAGCVFQQSPPNLLRRNCLSTPHKALCNRHIYTHPSAPREQKAATAFFLYLTPKNSHGRQLATLNVLSSRHFLQALESLRIEKNHWRYFSSAFYACPLPCVFHSKDS